MSLPESDCLAAINAEEATSSFSDFLVNIDLGKSEEAGQYNTKICDELIRWAVDSKIAHNHLTDLLKSLTRAGVTNLPSCA